MTIVVRGKLWGVHVWRARGASLKRFKWFESWAGGEGFNVPYVHLGFHWGRCTS